MKDKYYLLYGFGNNINIIEFNSKEECLRQLDIIKMEHNIYKVSHLIFKGTLIEGE